MTPFPFDLPNSDISQNDFESVKRSVVYSNPSDFVTEGYDNCRYRDICGNCLSNIEKSDDKYPYNPFVWFRKDDDDRRDRRYKDDKEWHESHMGIFYMSAGVITLGALTVFLLKNRK
jgi:hypothetical protein